jgi:hypothetical protein
MSNLPGTCLFSRGASLPTELNFFLRSERLLGYVRIVIVVRVRARLDSKVTFHEHEHEIQQPGESANKQ